MRFLIQMAYKGTAYHGWQKQKNAHSIQSELESKLCVLLKAEVETLGCGRTDTGVHATQFFAQFDYDKKLDTKTLTHKLNQILPKDISVYGIKKVTPDFNARFDAKYREYEYLISTKQNPFLVDYAWYFHRKLDVNAMNKACNILFDFEDFESFSKTGTQVKTYNCIIMAAGWKLKKDGTLIFTIKANRFLRNMVRAIVGTLVEVGLGRLDENGFRGIIESKSRTKAGQSVPAHGLFLTKVKY